MVDTLSIVPAFSFLCYRMMIMLMRYDSRLLRVLVCVANPSQYLPALFPLWVMPARVGDDYTTFVRVTFGRPR
jgi:hypothetical protein